MIQNILSNIKKMVAIVVRTMKILVTYKIELLSTIISPLVWVFLFGMFGKVFEGVYVQTLAQYGGDYVSYLILGVIFWQFVSMGLNVVSSQMRDEAVTGTLEAIYMTPTNLGIVFPAVSVISLLLSGIFAFIGIGLGILLFHFKIGMGNYFLVALIILLVYTSTLGIGMIIGGLTLVYKRIGAIVGIFITLMMFLSGVYFPVELLPQSLQIVSSAIPLTYALHSLRMVMLNGAGLLDVSGSILILVIISIITITAGYYFLELSIRKARQEGSIGVF